jgi:hypothetical protein
MSEKQVWKKPAEKHQQSFVFWAIYVGFEKKTE